MRLPSLFAGASLLCAVLVCTATAGQGTCAADDATCNEYASIAPEDLQVGDRFAAGTEKVLLKGTYKGQQVAVMDIFGRSKELDFAQQRKLAAHPVLGRHPHIVRVLGETSDGKYIVNELAELGSLANYDGSPGVFHRFRGMSLQVRLAIASQICEAMVALASAGFVFRDLAARNVLAFGMSRTDAAEVAVKLTDFGLMVGAGESRAWPPGHAMGTRWMAPESLLQWEWSEKRDVYSLRRAEFFEFSVFEFSVFISINPRYPSKEPSRAPCTPLSS